MSSISTGPGTKVPSGARLFAFFLALIIFAIGTYFLYGGYQLMVLGGSLYYLVAGIALIATAYLLARADARAGYLFAAFFVVTLLWALWESGLQFWPLAARLGMFTVVGLLIALCLPNLRGASKVKHIRSISYTVSAVLAVSVITAFVSAFSPIWLVKPTTKPAIAADYKPENEPDQWVGFGRTPSGEQFAPYSQINAENVKNLEVAWTFHTGDITGNGSENQNTPLQIGNILYPCTPTNQVFAVRGDTGEKLWHFDPG